MTTLTFGRKYLFYVDILTLKLEQTVQVVRGTEGNLQSVPIIPLQEGMVHDIPAKCYLRNTVKVKANDIQAEIRNLTERKHELIQFFESQAFLYKINPILCSTTQICL